MDLAKTYAKLRGSSGFLIGLVLFVILWLSSTVITGFDKDHGLINLCLSAEASISLAFFAMLQERSDAASKAQMDIIEQILKKMNERDQQMLEIVEDIQEEVDGN
jgi:uncharacterized membrane protein